MAYSARSTAYTQSQLNAMTKAELLETAGAMGLDVDSGNTKAEISAAILEVQNG